MACVAERVQRYIVVPLFPERHLLMPMLEESLTVLRGLGLQTSTTSSLYVHAPTTRFIPTTSIQDIFIHEGFKGFEVRFYLAVVVKGEEDVVVFPGLMPRRAILEEVWRGARTCLYDGTGARKSEKAKVKVDSRE
jgi:phosphatidylinositol glycan class H protein